MTKWFQLSQALPLYTSQEFVLFIQELKWSIITITINARLVRLEAGCTLCTVKMLPTACLVVAHVSSNIPFHIP